MKCMKCSKNIPDVSTTCPFCDHPVGVYVKDKDKITIPDEDLTSVKFDEETSKNNNLELKAYIDEPDKKNVKMGIIAIVVLVVVIILLVMFIMMNFTNKSKNEDYHELFTGTIKTFFDHFIENYTGNYAISSGEYKLNVQINYDSYAMSGSYGFDTKNRILALTGKAYSNSDSPDEIIVDYNELNYTLYLRRDEAYFSSEEVFDKPLLFPIKDSTGLLTTKSYDLESLLTGIEEGLIKAFETAELKTTDDNINHIGVSRDVSKTTLTLDNEARRKFYKALYQSFLDDSNFINELARIRNMSSNDMNSRIQKLYDDVDYTYPVGEDDDKTLFSIYHDGFKVYRIEMIVHEGDNNRNIELDIGNDIYTLEYYENGKNISSGSLEFSSKETNDIIRKNYKITYDDDNAQRTFDIEIQKHKSPDLKKYNFKDAVNVRDLTDEDYRKIEENIKVFTSEISWVRPFGESFANRCTPELNCNCPNNSKTCTCVYKNMMITCNKEDVTEKPKEEDKKDDEIEIID